MTFYATRSVYWSKTVNFYLKKKKKNPIITSHPEEELKVSSGLGCMKNHYGLNFSI